MSPPARRPGAGREGRDADRRHMRRALELARRGWGRVAPNPLVGAVALRDGEVVGEGWHAGPGAPHAEAAALEEAGEAARGSTVYVTLEPCTHHGRTPPCAGALVRAGVARVVVGCRDPHPEARGGLEVLREAGVEVAVGVAGREAARLNAPFLWRHAREPPFVTLKLALSLDARIARREGERSAVTGDAAWAHVHLLRAGHDAVLVGRRTAEVDDPRLTARGEREPATPPVRVVLDTELRLPPGSRLATSAGRAPLWVLCGPDPDPGRRSALEAAGARVVQVERGEEGRGLSPAAILGALADGGVGSVLVEGGGRVAASFLRDGCVQRMHLLYAPTLYGPDGVPGFPGVTAEQGAWRPAERGSLGDDTLLVLESAALAELVDRLGAGA